MFACLAVRKLDLEARAAVAVHAHVPFQLRNSRSHGLANLVRIEVREVEDKVSITIEDDGVGLSDSSSRPWAIASRVAELEGHMSMHSDGSTRLQIELPNS